MKILIIGGAGFLGAHTVRRCLRDPENEITVLDSLEPELHATTAHLEQVWDRITFVRGSMNDEGARYWIMVTRRGPAPRSTRLPKWKHCVVSTKHTVPGGPVIG